GPELALENAAQVTGRLDLETLRFRVHLAFTRSKQNVDVALALKLLDVGLQGARIAVEVLVGAELQPVDEDAGHDGAAMLARQFHQSQMPRMQVAHGGHERDMQLTAQLVAQLFDGVYDFQEGLRLRMRAKG